MFNSWKTAALLLALYRVLSSKCSIRNLFNRSIALTSSRFRFTRSVYVQVILWDKISGLRLFFNSWMSTMSQRLISAVQTFCFQEVANQKKGEGRCWSQAEDGLMGFTTDSIKIEKAIWPVEVLFFFKHWVESFLRRHAGCKVQQVTRFYRILPKIYFFGCRVSFMCLCQRINTWRW